MKPGHEFDVLIAREVMGWHVGAPHVTFADTHKEYKSCWYTMDMPGNPICTITGMPMFSQFTTEAFDAVVHFCETRGFHFTLGGPANTLSRWMCAVYAPTPIIGWGDTAAEAICVATLQAAREKRNDQA